MKRRTPLFAALGSLAALAFAACTINPVTGQRQVSIVSTADELAIGAAQYAPSRQMQGGDYILDPELTAYVNGVGNRLAAVSDRPLPYEFAILNNGVPNAWALPGGKIAVNRGLLVELDSEAELAAVLGHEIVHAAARHGAQAMQRGLLLQGAILVTAMAAQRGNHSNLVVGAASLGAQLVNQRYSRGAELESDEYGMIYMSRAGYDPRAAVDLQRTFVRLAAERPTQGWLEGLFASHPPSAERVERNEATLARLPAGGEIGRERFQAATSRLRAMQPAYDLYDEGRAALADGRLDEAQNLAERAIGITADEADFHALLGDVALARGRPRDAADDLRDAIARNDRYFYYPLKLGTALLDLNELAASAEQFEASLELLPTADAHYGLGRIAQRSGDIASALEHYRLAASSSSDTGRAAEDAIVQIDLPSNPGAYLQVATGLDSQSRLLVDITNPTRYSVTDIDLTIRYVDGGGAIVTTGRTVTSTLPPGTTQRLSTGLGPFASPNGYEILLERARVIEP